MSIKVMSWVMDDAPVENTTEMVVLYVLADHAHDDGACAWPSHSTIADKTRCSRRTVIRHIKALEQRGLIYRGDQRHVAHLPADRRPVVWNLNMTMKRQMPDDAGCQNVTPQSSGVTSSAERGDNGGMSGVTSSAERGDTGVTQPVLDPSLDPSLTHPPLTPQGEAGGPQQQALVVDSSAEPPAEPKPKKATPRAELLPEGWYPDRAVAEKLHGEFPHLDLAAEHEGFTDYWNSVPASKGRKRDWNATWRIWMRKQGQQRRGGGQNRAQNVASRADEKAMGYFAVADELRRQAGAQDMFGGGHRALGR